MRIAAYLSALVALSLSVHAAALPAGSVELDARATRTVAGCVKKIKANKLQGFCRKYVKGYKKNDCEPTAQELPDVISRYSKAMVIKACAKVTGISIEKCKQYNKTKANASATSTTAQSQATPPASSAPTTSTPKLAPFTDTTGCFGGAEMPGDANDLNICTSCHCEYTSSETYVSSGGDGTAKPTLVLCRYDGASATYPDTFTYPLTVPAEAADDSEMQSKASTHVGFWLQGASGGGGGKTGGPGASIATGVGIGTGVALAKGTTFDIFVGQAGATGAGHGHSTAVAAGGRGGGGIATGGGSGGGGATWLAPHGSTTDDAILALAGGGGGAGMDAVPSDASNTVAWGGMGQGDCLRTPNRDEVCTRSEDGNGDWPNRRDPVWGSDNAVPSGTSGGGAGGAGWLSGARGISRGGATSYTGGAGGTRKTGATGFTIDGYTLTTFPTDGNGAAYAYFGCARIQLDG